MRKQQGANGKREYNQTHFEKAIREDNLATLEIIFEVHPNFFEQDPEKILKLAAEFCAVQAFHYLGQKHIEKVGNNDLVKQCINQPGLYKQRKRCLVHVLASNQLWKYANWYDQNGADFNQAPLDKSHNYVICIVISCGDLKGIEVLMELSQKVNANIRQNENDITPLMLCAQKQNDQMTEYLLCMGADTSLSRYDSDLGRTLYAHNYDRKETGYLYQKAILIFTILATSGENPQYVEDIFTHLQHRTVFNKKSLLALQQEAATSKKQTELRFSKPQEKPFSTEQAQQKRQLPSIPPEAKDKKSESAAKEKEEAEKIESSKKEGEGQKQDQASERRRKKKPHSNRSRRPKKESQPENKETDTKPQSTTTVKPAASSSSTLSSGNRHLLLVSLSREDKKKQEDLIALLSNFKHKPLDFLRYSLKYHFKLLNENGGLTPEEFYHLQLLIKYLDDLNEQVKTEIEKIGKATDADKFDKRVYSLHTQKILGVTEVISTLLESLVEKGTADYTTCVFYEFEKKKGFSMEPDDSIVRNKSSLFSLESKTASMNLNNSNCGVWVWYQRQKLEIQITPHPQSPVGVYNNLPDLFGALLIFMAKQEENNNNFEISK